MRAAIVVGIVLLCGIVQGAEPKTVTNKIGMELVEIPAGTFTMGSPAGERDRQPDEEQVAVTLSELFWLGKYEVTQGQWQVVMGREPWAGQQFVTSDKQAAATFVSWDNAREFCQRLTDIDHKNGKPPPGESYRLPTEAEWEYACRAGTQTTWSFGNDRSQLGNYDWYEGNAKNVGQGYAHKVGLKKPNPWGLYDMPGNVMEWCSDGYNKKLLGGTDPVGPRGGSIRVLRGGGWRGSPGYCRSASRGHYVPSLSSSGLGFRVARSQSGTVAERRQQGAQAEPAPQVAAAERPVQLEVKSNSIGMKLVELPAGKFTMGDGGGIAVTLTKPFLLGTTEVTQGQFKKVMGTEPWVGKDYVQIDKNGPASYVSWEEARAFCDELTELEQDAGKLKAGEAYRLPTEAEWEYACRAGTTTAYSFGDDEKQLGQYAWFKVNAFDAGERYAHAVGLKKSNPWGLYDMHGNVYEWCSDWYGDELSGGTDPVGPGGGSHRVDRGGGWWGTPGLCRSANRSCSVPSYRGGLGFRVARSQSAQ